MTTPMIRTPDHRLRVFISSTLQELADERRAVRDAVRRLRLAPVMFEAGARPHPPRDLYRSYLAQSHIFVGIYWQSYGWVAPDEAISGLEDEYQLSGDLPKLIYVKTPAPDREPRLTDLLGRVKNDDRASYQRFNSADELGELIENDLALLLTERFEQTAAWPSTGPESDALDTVPIPPASPAPAPARLVKPVTPMIGRRDDLERLLTVLADGVRLVTLTGPGGIGKTRLALAVAERLQSAGDRDVGWVALAGTRNPALVPSLIAAALGIPEVPTQPVLDSVCEHLADRPTLLVLDNFEQVLGAAPDVTTILQRCPRTSIVVASRSVLNVRGEHDVPVQPLVVPADDDEPHEVTDAMRLFESRAAAVSPGFEITPDNIACIAAICRRLDGLPLAIELAAARIRLMTPEAILRRLDRRLALLTSGARDLPERQRTLRATLNWDYESLSDDERTLFRRLAVFAGGLTLDAAAAIDTALGGLTCTEIFECISSLINRSLLRLDVGGSGQPRFAMLETIREYAHEQLETAGEAPAAHAAHAAYFAGYVHETFLRGSDQVDKLSLLEDEHANFRVALDRAVEVGDVDLELQLVSELAPFWGTHGHLREGAARVSAALQRSAGRRDALRARIALAAVIFDRVKLDFDHARTLADEALTIARDVGDDELIGWALKDVGLIAQELGDYPAAQASAREAIEHFERAGQRLGASWVLNNLAVSYLDQGHYDEAIGYFAECCRRFDELRDAVGGTRSFQNIGLATLESGGDPMVAQEFLGRALLRFLRLGSLWDVADCLDFFATAVAAAGRRDAAAELMGTSNSLRSRIGAPRPDYAVDAYRTYGVLLDDGSVDAGLTVAAEAGSTRTISELPGLLADRLPADVLDLTGTAAEERLLGRLSPAPGGNPGGATGHLIHP